ncbi:MAG: hypothetical protein AVDCRST_MAG57-2876, partial [uncultured Blastococcus sp.]
DGSQPLVGADDADLHRPAAHGAAAGLAPARFRRPVRPDRSVRLSGAVRPSGAVRLPGALRPGAPVGAGPAARPAEARPGDQRGRPRLRAGRPRAHRLPLPLVPLLDRRRCRRRGRRRLLADGVERAGQSGRRAGCPPVGVRGGARRRRGLAAALPPPGCLAGPGGGAGRPAGAGGVLGAAAGLAARRDRDRRRRDLRLLAVLRRGSAGRARPPPERTGPTLVRRHPARL